ncbi:hydrogenase maturation nickel metallochaperone HypA [Flexistipes sinusarabici]|uniref:Hydrogenase maturation factor HypA n=1 Tax=Flexistipes sinusarabici TaxID=2352 RepID=A0A3D5QAU8_FLESI|nr:hydrogenase maturation nickel metallochaperone HypA [Flexistipes sinusarabici]HCW92780.1 hydrogenase maturation nickel metallochaperone HypA [Flexistipes sinusarabici]
MHEVGIAQNILDIAVESALNNKAEIINKIHVKIGRLAAVENDALLFAFDALKEGTIAANALLKIEDIPIKGRCIDCKHEDFYDEMFFSCKKCGSYKVELLTGEELNITEIEVD